MIRFTFSQLPPPADQRGTTPRWAAAAVPKTDPHRLVPTLRRALAPEVPGSDEPRVADVGWEARKPRWCCSA